jgi:hypothetical protein
MRMHPWTDSWAFWAGLFSFLAGIGAIVAGLVANRRSPYMPAGSTSRSGAAPEAIEGYAQAIVTLESPTTNSECVLYEERVDASVPPGDLHSDDDGKLAEVIEETVDFEIVDRSVGVFLLASEAGKALVWPGLGTVSYMDSWTSRENDSENRTSAERMLKAGVIVRVRGEPGMFSQMMEEMSQAADDLPEDLLHALQTRADLIQLPCYWPRKRGEFSVEEEGAELDEGDEVAGPVAHYVMSGVAFVLSGLLLFCAYRSIL